MSLLQAHELAFRYADFLFQKTSFELNPGDRVGLVGPNGGGKTTLLRLLAGELEADAGTLARRRGLRVAYLRQDVAAATGQSVSAWLAAADTPELERDLYGLGFASEDLRLPLTALSAGQRSRAHLARCLSAQPDLLLLDEPTNHLDLSAREWLTARLLEFEGAAVVVSHDRRLLETVTNRTFELRRGEFRSYGGGYAWYERERSRRSAQHWAQYEEQQGRLAAFERAAERRARLARSVAQTPEGVRGGKDFYARKSAKVARTGRLLREREFHEPKVGKPWQEDPIPVLDFSRVARAAAVPIELERVSKSYGGKPVLRELSLRVQRGERWAVRGPNGCGKTTLFRLLLGLEQADSGRITIGPNVQFGYYAQEAENLDPQRTPVEICCGEGADATWVRTLLACLKLPRELAEQPVGLLSLGERAKVALTRVLVSGANVLLLDEPTNHLEIEAQEALEEALRQYPGTILLVSHDARFTETVAEHVLELGAHAGGGGAGLY